MPVVVCDSEGPEMAYILVVDGDAVTRAVVRALLEDAGHEVAEATEGWAGLAIMGRRVPDLVITELYMDGMEGIEFLRRVRETWPSEPVLVMSTRDHPGAASILGIAKLLGATGLLEKPIVASQLVETVGSILVA